MDSHKKCSRYTQSDEKYDLLYVYDPLAWPGLAKKFEEAFMVEIIVSEINTVNSAHVTTMCTHVLYMQL